MKPFIPEKMKAAAFDRFGGPEVLQPHELPVPKPKNKEVLIRLEYAGIGVWDGYVRSGDLQLSEGGGGFPKVIGNDGAGTVVAVGEGVGRFKVGDRVYSCTYQGGFYAQYVAVKEDEVALAPPNLPTDEAGALGSDGVTAIIGLEDQLKLRKGESLLIYGASGGIGHLAVQLAKRMGVHVIAVASGPDGAALVRRLGADVVIDGKQGDLSGVERQFPPGGVDAALILTGEGPLQQALGCIKQGGRVAYPNGVHPEPKVPPGIQVTTYDGISTPEIFERLNTWITSAPFHVELGKIYPLEDAARAHRELGQHHLGKWALRIHAH